MKTQQQNRPFPWFLFSVFLLFAIGILGTGYFYYQNRQVQLKSEAYRNLAAIADLKIGQIVRWQNDRIGDANLICENVPLIRQISEFYKTGNDIKHKEELKRWMNSFRKYYGYGDIFLIDTRGAIRLSTASENKAVCTKTLSLLPEIIHRREVIFTDLHQSQEGSDIHIDLLVPLISTENENNVFGIVSLQIDPSIELYPLILSWPTSSRTSETLLLEREGDEVLYLNELRFNKKTALRLRLPISDQQLPAAMAARGKEGMVEGINYSNIPVLAAIRKIPNSLWFIITQVNQAEIYESLYFQEKILGGAVFLLFISVTTVIGLWWRLQQAGFYRKQYQAEMERKALFTHYDYLIHYANDVILLLDENGRLIEANEQACQTYGYTREEILQLNISDLRSPETRLKVAMQMKRLEEQDGTVFETEHQRKDGTVIPVEVSSRSLEIEGIKFYQNIIRDITERKRSEESLIRSLSLLQATLESTADGILVVDTSGKITGSNEQFANMWNIPASIIASGDDSKSLSYELNQLKNPDEFIRKVNDLYSQPELDSFDILEFKDGRIFERYSHPQRIKGRAVGRVWSFRNVTKQKRTADALREGEQRLSQITSSLSEAVWLRDAKTREILYVNPAFEKIFGISNERFIQNPALIWDVLNPEDHPWILETSESQHQGESSDKEFRIVRPDGAVRWIRDRVYPVRNDANELARIATIAEDITERKNSEEAIRENEERFRRIFEEGPLGMVTSSSDFHFIKANDAFCRMMGYTQHELSSHTLKDITHPEHIIGDVEAINNLFLGKIPVYRTEKRYIRKDKRIVWGSLTVTVIQNEKGQFSYFLAMIEDITEQKKLQQELLQSQKLLSIGTMAGGIAHDFNNILGIILGYASILPSIKDNHQRFSDGVNAIKQAVDRGAGLVRQILTFARKTDVSFEPLSVPVLMQELVSMLQQTFPKLITFNVRSESGLPYIKADHTQMHQALLNLCVNARDAMPNGGEITLIAETITGEKLRERFPAAHQLCYICVSIIDSGIGIEEKILHQIFDPFFTTKEKDKGTGLGLSVVYGIVQTHQGFVDVESTVGSGTTFRIYLPVPQETSLTFGIQKQVIDVIPNGTETILFVEDEKLLVEMVNILLETYGYTMLLARNGEEAVDIYSQHSHEIALVITDMGLPLLRGMDEFEKLKEINPEVRVIFASGYFEPDVKSKLLNAGAKGFLQKPYIIEEILLKIREVLDSK